MGHQAGRRENWQTQFLASLQRDLKAAGFRVRSSSNGMPFGIRPPDHRGMLMQMRCQRQQQIASASEFILKMEAMGILNRFAHGAAIGLESIRPEIRFCASISDHEIFRYCKLFQRMATAARAGVDVGQECPTLIGIFELASGSYTLGSRDQYLNWRGPSQVHIKQKGLRRLMDLASIIAMPAVWWKAARRTRTIQHNRAGIREAVSIAVARPGRNFGNGPSLRDFESYRTEAGRALPPDWRHHWLQHAIRQREHA
jgi:hypothetical protein